MAMRVAGEQEGAWWLYHYVTIWQRECASHKPSHILPFLCSHVHSISRCSWNKLVMVGGKVVRRQKWKKFGWLILFVVMHWGKGVMYPPLMGVSLLGICSLPLIAKGCDHWHLWTRNVQTIGWMIARWEGDVWSIGRGCNQGKQKSNRSQHSLPTLNYP